MAEITNAQIQQFVQANLNNPAVIAQASQQYGISPTQIAQATGYPLAQVQSYLAPYTGGAQPGGVTGTGGGTAQPNPTAGTNPDGTPTTTAQYQQNLQNSAINQQLQSNVPTPQMTPASAGNPFLAAGSNPLAAALSQGATPGTGAYSSGANLGPLNQMGAATLSGVPQVGPASIDYSRVGSAQGVGASAGTANAAQMQAANLRDPSQQGTNLQPGFQDFIYGDQGANPYLQGALQRGANQARDAYGNLLQDQAENFSENILGNIRSSAIQAGGLGGSRQGIAEGIAAREQAQAANRAATQLGSDLNSAMIGAQSANFQQGRGLGAGLLGSLSGQQYGQNQVGAGLQQAANQTNAQLGTSASIANAGNQTQAGVASAANQTGASIANLNAMAGLAGQQAGLTQQGNIANAGYQMTGALADQSALNQAGQFNTGQANQYNLTAGQLGQQNNQFNAGVNLAGTQMDQQNQQYNAGALNTVGLANNQLGQQAQQYNAGALNNMNQYNAGLQQQANQTNLGAGLQTNALNQNTMQAGIGNAAQQYRDMSNVAQNQQNYDLARTTGLMGAFAPYAQMYSGQTTSTPLYNNPFLGALGGAVSGYQLGNIF